MQEDSQSSLTSSKAWETFWKIEWEEHQVSKEEVNATISSQMKYPILERWRGVVHNLTKVMQLRLWKLIDSGSSFSYKIHEAPLQDDTNMKQLLVKTLVEPLSD